MMRIDLKKTLFTGLFVALAAGTSVGYAGSDRGSGFWKPFEPSVDGPENVVISLGTDPTVDAEPACVALQIGMNLLMDDLNGTEAGGKVTPADHVVLFATLDGVKLVASNSDLSATCFTPGGQQPLSEILSQFLGRGGDVVVCSLCWNARGYLETQLTYGIVAEASDIHSLFLYADKVIPF
jgi:predicted peroxiredoxin